MEENKKLRKCLYSGEDFIPKRNNQIFASKKNRVSYHNNLCNKLRHELKNTNFHLVLNHKICKEVLNGQKTVRVHREFLKGKGFDFRYFTNMVENKTKTAYICAIYDACFEKTDDNNYQITRYD